MIRIRHLASTLALAALLLLSFAVTPAQADGCHRHRDSRVRCHAGPGYYGGYGYGGYGYGGSYVPATVGVVMRDGTILKVTPQQAQELQRYGGQVFSPYSAPPAWDGQVYSSSVLAPLPTSTNRSHYP